jgi:hypothetical protein
MDVLFVLQPVTSETLGILNKLKYNWIFNTFNTMQLLNLIS